MMRRRSMQSTLGCRLLLRSAAVLVPNRGRADWLAEWKAELWQVLRSQEACRDQTIDEGAMPRCVSGRVVAAAK
jgi:hypothetical protein